MASIRATVTGNTAQLFKQIQNLSDADKAATTRAIAEGLRTSTMERFDKSISPEGKKWKNSIRAQNTGGKTLVKSSILKNSIRTEADKSGMAVGTNNIYAATHQFGEKGRIIKPKRGKVLHFQINGKWVSAKQVKIKIPARPFLGISEADNEEIMETLDEMMKG